MKKLASLLLAAMMLIFCACGPATFSPEESSATETTAPPLRENPLGFDPHNAAGWSSYENHELWRNWMQAEQLLVTPEDYTLGPFFFNQPLTEARAFIPEGAQEQERQVYEELAELTVTFEGWELMFISNEGEPYQLYNAMLHGSDTASPRGLRLGDSVAVLYELYGIPLRVREEIWIFGDGYEVFQVGVEDGLVRSMKLCGVM